MTRVTRRRLVQSGATGVLGAVAAPSLALALAQNKRWRMVTSWPKRLPGPGMSAERVAERIKSMSGGRLDIAVHAASNPGVFDKAAIGALSQWRYQPVVRDGKSVAQRARIRIRFALAD